MTSPAAPPKRPYLLRAMHQWISDCGNTPHVIVDADRAGTEIPRAYVKEGKIVLNLSFTATQRLKLGNDDVEFDARFAGVVHHVSFPVASVMGIYARETGEGMVFSDQDLGPEPPRPPGSEEGNGNTAPQRARPQLKVVK
jgi:stringent starvation protein B